MTEHYAYPQCVILDGKIKTYTCTFVNICVQLNTTHIPQCFLPTLLVSNQGHLLSYACVYKSVPKRSFLLALYSNAVGSLCYAGKNLYSCTICYETKQLACSKFIYTITSSEIVMYGIENSIQPYTNCCLTFL